jgi:hypothetical protein
MALAGGGREQIAQALLQGDPLGLGAGPEGGHHVVIELADEHLGHDNARR